MARDAAEMTFVEYRCDYCGLTFLNGLQLGPHKKKCARTVAPTAVFTSFSNSDDDSAENIAENDEPENLSENDEPGNDDIATHGAGAGGQINLRTLAQRPINWGVRAPLRVARPICRYDPRMTHDFVPVLIHTCACVCC